MLGGTSYIVVTYIVSYLRHSLYRLRLAVCGCCPHRPYDLFQDKHKSEPQNIGAQALDHFEKNDAVIDYGK